MTPPRPSGERTTRRCAHYAAVAPPRSTSVVRCLEAPPLHPATAHRQGATHHRSGKGKAGSGPRGAGSAPLRHRHHQGRRGRRASRLCPRDSAVSRDSPAAAVMESRAGTPAGPSGGGRARRRKGGLGEGGGEGRRPSRPGGGDRAARSPFSSELRRPHSVCFG
jgi:hypothetical protein